MTKQLNFSRFKKKFVLSESEIIKHIVNRFHTDLTPKQQVVMGFHLDLLFKSAFKLSSEKGFSNVTIRDLLNDSGVGTSSLYKCFDSKDKMSLMICEGVAYITAKSVLALKEGSVNKEREMELLIKGHVYIIEMFKPWFFFVYSDVLAMTKEFEERLQTIQIMYLGRLQKCFGSTIITSDVALVLQDYYLRISKYRDVDADTYAEHCYKFALVLMKNAKEFEDLSLDLKSVKPEK